MRGFFFFLVFICKSSVWENTKKRHPKLTKAIVCPFSFIGRKFYGIHPDQVLHFTYYDNSKAYKLFDGTGICYAALDPIKNCQNVIYKTVFLKISKAIFAHLI
jgi:hypothetical protein